ncbi:MAG: mannose-1-phosphate guanylyltransferase/mannose-6-phosphate isomerase [Alphaproteobacteria bacterium]|nr:mannose-1-phosphate guanylyltransferase/mannose-6-phosphate isomerase [Alphaproteobacteria bacterium]
MPNGPITPVILSGGSGTRLWPMSRRDYPKQFLPLAGDNTMLQETALRVGAPKRFAPVLVVCNEEHRFMVAEQLRRREQTPQGILLEPVGRNTAPALTAAALWLLERDPDATMLVLPSDHVVQDVQAFREAAYIAAEAAQSGMLVTFGITPRAPETGFGYIAAGETIEGADGTRRVDDFVEKPDLATAQGFVAGGNHFWNSGMFVFRADTLVSEIDRLTPDTSTACRAALAGGSADLDFFRMDAGAFGTAPATSIDYAVMEKTDRAAVVPVDMGWSDVGSWRALWEIGAKDNAGNVVVGNVVQVGSRDCYLRSDGTLVAAIGLEDFVVVASTDAVLVAPKDEVQQVRDIVEQLGQSGRSEAVTFPEVYRPWGWHKTLNKGPGFHVKRISLHPGGRVSLRRHRHADQHWTVVDGTAEVTLEDTTHTLEPGESISVPAGAVHALATAENRALTLIEVQAGPNAGKDEFERLENV